MAGPIATKLCTRCDLILPVTEFTRRGDSARLRSHCRACRGKYTVTYRAANPDRAAEIQAAATQRWYRNNRERELAKSRRQRFGNYGITQQEFEDLLVAQGGVCAICGMPETSRARVDNEKVRSLAIDHDHETGAIRGLLCMNCNQGLGKFKDNVLNLLKAVEYLRREA